MTTSANPNDRRHPTGLSLSVLLKDRFLATGLGIAGIYSLVLGLPGIFPFAVREFVSWYIIDPLLILVCLWAIRGRDRQGESLTSERFWQYISFALACWFLATISNFWFDQLQANLLFAVSIDILHVSYYLAFIFSLDIRPDLRRVPPQLSADERINLFGAVAFCLAMLDYFVLIPSFLDVGDRDTIRPSLLLYLGLDVLLALRFATQAWSAGTERWRWIYGSFATLAVGWAMLVLLELWSLTPSSTIPTYAGTPWDLIWLFPFVPLLASTRLPKLLQLSDDPSEGVAITASTMSGGRSPWGPVLLYALTLPTIHLLMHHTQLLSEDSLEARELLVLIYFVFAGGLALLQYRKRERQRRDSQEQLEESETRFRQLVESSADAILVEQNGSIVYFNPEAARLLGAERLTEDYSFEALGLPEPSISRFLTLRNPRSPATLPIEYRLWGKEGPLEVEISYLWIKFQGVTSCQALIHDVTAERRLRDEVEGMERLAALGEFSAMIAHEIRNPLASLLFNFRVLEKQLAERRGNREKLEGIEEAVDHMQALVKGILEFSRTDRVHLVEEDVVSIAESALRTVTEGLVAHGITVHREVDERGEVTVDIHQMVRAFSHLFDNAIQAMPDGGDLYLRTRRQGPRILVEVEDTGEGIASGDLGSVRDPFFSRRPDGLGLGLALVSQILERHGCSLDLTSEPGVGTRATVSVPLAADVAAR